MNESVLCESCARTHCTDEVSLCSTTCAQWLPVRTGRTLQPGTDQVKRDPRDPARLALRHLRLNGANGYVWRALKARVSSTRCCGDNEATFTTEG